MWKDKCYTVGNVIDYYTYLQRAIRHKKYIMIVVVVISWYFYFHTAFFVLKNEINQQKLNRCNTSYLKYSQYNDIPHSYVPYHYYTILY